jgi:hypothetical protein
MAKPFRRAFGQETMDTPLMAAIGQIQMRPDRHHHAPSPEDSLFQHSHGLTGVPTFPAQIFCYINKLKIVEGSIHLFKQFITLVRKLSIKIVKEFNICPTNS